MNQFPSADHLASWGCKNSYFTAFFQRIAAHRGASERSWPSVIPCSSSAITCSSADVVSRTWGSITSTSSIRKNLLAISSNF
jgi:hypothetical protein